MSQRYRLAIGGYVLAGGASSRMGRDKALLELAGKPLIAHAVTKLGRICQSVAILSSAPALSAFAPLVEDLHPGCGPMGGMEAALAHSDYDWNLILPVDVPFLPTALLQLWASATQGHHSRRGTRAAMYEVEGLPQPALLMLHRDMAPYLTVSLAHGDYKLGPALHRAAHEIAEKCAVPETTVLQKWAWTSQSRLKIGGDDDPPGALWRTVTDAQQQARPRWFANLNTPRDLAEAERHADALDT